MKYQMGCSNDKRLEAMESGIDVRFEVGISVKWSSVACA